MRASSLILLGGLALAAAKSCTSMEDCSLNGICTCHHTCRCDPGWTGSNCGKLDLQPVERWTGYNNTNFTNPDFYREGGGNSSWGGQIIHDREDKGLFHFIASQFKHGCGLSAWRPFSQVIRAESRTGPRGPFIWKQTLFDTFRHNPTVVWSPADEKYLIHFIGQDWETPDVCRSTKTNNTISVSTSPDLKEWTEQIPLVVNVTNPTAWPLWTEDDHTPEMLLASEKNNIYYSPTGYAGPYNLTVEPGNIEIHPSMRSEDPFLWRDKRGHWHFLVHHMADIPLGLKGPRVGAHAFARDWRGPWTYENETLAFDAFVDFTDGGRTEYYRRERPKLYFSEDGEMTPLYLVNGVQEFGNISAYTLVQPIGEAWKAYEDALGR
ncbi:uncharacterized protein F5Z01DRAFT_629724 [Emericellopsis atlantica]|uniref:EGF-like domain-containing protein n=1 Tax=Emericellopsis atlantica TaxID=2614577 RepID=A0A9P8CM59_9HYPO|nr:uncharacterized protein F5Z01DRAFT_629724 [Emericellopsis atlantica]KAG9250336.1 hypothetical protein F5Z01DRAFT_629724 [Emericellopsis atlantica]